MRYHFFSIPVAAPEGAAKALNQLLGSHRVVSIDRQFVPDGANSFWAVCVSVAWHNRSRVTESLSNAHRSPAFVEGRA